MTAQGRPVRRGSAFYAVIFFWSMTPVVLAVLLFARNYTMQIESPQQVWGKLEQTIERPKSPVGLILEWGDTVEVFAPEWHGTVQAVYAESNQEISTGSKILKIAGIERLAVITPEPFTRYLSFDAEGEDVLQLNDMLATFGFDNENGSRFTEQTLSGVQQFALSIGVTETVYTFDPNWIVYLPRALTIKSVSLHAGSPAPSTGAVILDGQQGLQSATVVAETVARAILQDPEHTDLAMNESVESVAVNEDLYVGNFSPLLDANRKAIADESLLDLSYLVSPLTPATFGVLQSENTTEAWVVPSIAIYLDDGGRSCVLVMRDESQVGVQIKVLATNETASYVQADFRVDDEVALLPQLSPLPCN